jgi:hypothetical protein
MIKRTAEHLVAEMHRPHRLAAIGQQFAPANIGPQAQRHPTERGSGGEGHGRRGHVAEGDQPRDGSDHRTQKERAEDFDAGRCRHLDPRHRRSGQLDPQRRFPPDRRHRGPQGFDLRLNPRNVARGIGEVNHEKGRVGVG